MSTHSLSTADTDRATGASTPLDLIYTNFLIHNDRMFRIDCPQESDPCRLQAADGELIMPEGCIAIRPRSLPTYDRSGDISELDVCTWEEGRQILEDFDWPSITSSNGELGMQVNNTDYIDESLRVTLGSPGRHHTSTSLDPVNIYAPETPVLPFDHTERDDFDDIEQEHLPSPAASENDTTRVPVISFITESTLVRPDTSMSTATTPLLQNTLVDEFGCAFSRAGVTATVEVIKEVPCIPASTEGQCSQTSLHMLREVEIVHKDESVQAPEVVSGTLVPNYPPTPALSVSKLHLPVDEVRFEQAKGERHEALEQTRGETISTAGAEPPLFHGLSDHRHVTDVGKHRYNASSDTFDLHTAANRPDTIATSDINVSPDATKGPDEAGLSRTSPDAPNEMDLDNSTNDSTHSKPLSPVPDQIEQAALHIRHDTGNAQSIHAEECGRLAARSPLVTSVESIHARTAGVTATHTCNDNMTEHSAEFGEEMKEHILHSGTQQTVPNYDAMRSNDNMLEDQMRPHSDKVPPCLDASTRPDSFSASAAVVSPVVNRKEKPMPNTDAPTALSVCVLDSQVIPRPRKDIQIQLYIAKEEVIRSRLPQRDGQAALIVQAAVAEPSIALSIQSASVVSNDPFTPPASPILRLSKIDLPSIIATRPSTTATSTRGTKRQHSSMEPELDLNEGPTAKKHTLCSTEPSVIWVEDEVEIVAAETEDLEAVEYGSNKGSGYKQDLTLGKQAASSNTQDEDGPDVVSATVPISAIGDFEKAHQTPAIDDSARIHTAMPVKEDCSEPMDTSRDILTGKANETEEHGAERCEPVSSSTVPSTQFVGPYVQAPSADTEERVTTASLSPTRVPSVPQLSSSAEDIRSRITFKPSKPPTDQLAPVKSEALGHEEDKQEISKEQMFDTGHTDSDESDELTEVDDEEMSLLSAALEAHYESAPQDIPPTKTSTPDSVSTDQEPIARSEAQEAVAADLPRTQLSPAARHEAELHYERRTTRSETRTSAHDSAPASIEDAIDTVCAPAIKHEHAAPSRRQRQKPEGKNPQRAPTQDTIREHDGTFAGAEDADNSTSKSTCMEMPLHTFPAATAVTSTSTPTHKLNTPLPQTLPAGPKPRKTTPLIVHGARSKRKALLAERDRAVGGESLGKRKTRGSSAVEEESRKASAREGNIKKRLRGSGE